jgi:pyruvate-formate lyase
LTGLLDEATISFDMTTRTQGLKKRLLESPFQVCPERAVLWTESMMRTEGKPQVVRNALALKNVLENMTVTIREDELIAGARTSKRKGAPLFPEIKSFSIQAELDTYPTRPIQPFQVSDDDRRALKRVLPYWRGRSAWDAAFRMIPRSLQRDIFSIMYTVEAEFANGIGHFIVGNHKPLAKGFGGIRDQAESRLASISGEDSTSRRHFWEAVEITSDAAINFAARYASEARRLAGLESDPTRKEELMRIARICDHVPEHPPQDFREALQSVWFNQLICQLECGGFAISPGRLDQLLYPFYRCDLEDGNITAQDAKELIECLFVKMSEVVNVLDTVILPVTSGPPIAQSLTIGGTDEQGRDATNDLTYLFLEAHDSIRMVAPNLAVRFHPHTPKDFTSRVCEAVRRGSMMSLFNDEVIVEALEERGISPEDARGYAIVGCVEPTASGNAFCSTDSNLVNIARCLELALKNGDGMDMVSERRALARLSRSYLRPSRDGRGNGRQTRYAHIWMLIRYLAMLNRRTDMSLSDVYTMLRGRSLGPRTGDAHMFKSIDDVLAAYHKQVHHFVSRMVQAMEYCDKVHAELKPTPFISSCIDDCLENGKDVTWGGARYNFTGPQAIGLADVADSLAALNTLVFDQGRVSMDEILEAMKTDFKGEESLRQMLINRAPKFGNDEEEVDMLAREAAAIYCGEVAKHPNFRGGSYRPGIYSMSSHIVFGLFTGATPDGRHAGDILGSGVSPRQGMEMKGPTAVMRSVARVDGEQVSNGYVLNMSFDPNLVAGQDNLDKFADLLMAYFRLGGMHVHYNVVSAETLRQAQKNPEDYRGLVVRVAGYSGLFTELDRATQNDIISRKMHGCES